MKQVSTSPRPGERRDALDRAERGSCQLDPPVDRLDLGLHLAAWIPAGRRDRRDLKAVALEGITYRAGS